MNYGSIKIGDGSLKMEINKASMTPKEKAKDLIDKYYLTIFNYGEDLSQEIIISILAKQCALIAVDEILRRNEPIQGHFWSYWEEVKQEIKNKQD